MFFSRYIDVPPRRWVAFLVLLTFTFDNIPIAFAQSPSSQKPDPYVEVQQVGQACIESMNGDTRAVPYQTIASQIYVGSDNVAQRISISDLNTQIATLASRPDFNQLEENFAKDATWVYMTHALHHWKRRKYETTGSSEIDLGDLKSIPEVGGPLTFIKPMWKHVPTGTTLVDSTILNDEVAAFNNFILMINESCTNANKVYKVLIDAYQSKLKQDSEFNPRLYEILDTNTNGAITQGGIQGRIRKRIRELRVSTAIETGLLEAIISQSMFGAMYDIDTPFRKEVGKHNDIACVENGQQLKTVSVARVKNIINTSAQKIDEKSKAGIFNIVKRIYDGDKLKQYFPLAYQDAIEASASKMDADDLLKQYIQENPYSLQQALIANPNKQNALIACKLIQEIKRSNINKEDALTALSVFAAVITGGASIATEGVGATILTISAILLDGYFFVSSIMDLALSYEIQDRLENSILAGQIDSAVGKELVTNVQNSRPFSVLNIALSGLGLATATTRAAQLSKLASTKRVINGTKVVGKGELKILTREEMQALAKKADLNPTEGGMTPAAANRDYLFKNFKNGQYIKDGGSQMTSQEIRNIKNWMEGLSSNSGKPTTGSSSGGVVKPSSPLTPATSKATASTAATTLTKPVVKPQGVKITKPQITNSTKTLPISQTKIQVGDPVQKTKPAKAPVIAAPKILTNIENEEDGVEDTSPTFPPNRMDEAKKLLENGGMYDPMYKMEICRIAQNDSGRLGDLARELISKNKIDCPTEAVLSGTATNPYLPDYSDEVAHQTEEVLNATKSHKTGWEAVEIQYKRSTNGRPIKPNNQLTVTTIAEVILFDQQNRRFLVLEKNGTGRWLSYNDPKIEFMQVTRTFKPSKVKFYTASKNKDQERFRGAFLNGSLESGARISISNNQYAIILGQRGDRVAIQVEDMASQIKEMNLTNLRNASFLPEEELGPRIPLNKEKNRIMAEKVDKEFFNLINELNYYNRNLLTKNQSYMPTDIYERLRIMSATPEDFDTAWLHDFNGSALEATYDNIRNLYYNSIMYMSDILNSNGIATQWIVRENRTILQMTLPRGFVWAARGSTPEFFFDPIHAYVRQHSTPEAIYYDFNTIQDFFTRLEEGNAPSDVSVSFDKLQTMDKNLENLVEKRTDIIHGDDGFDNLEHMRLVTMLENFTIQEKDYKRLAEILGIEVSSILTVQSRIFDAIEQETAEVEMLLNQHGYMTRKTPFILGSNRKILKIYPKSIGDPIQELLKDASPKTEIFFDPFIDHTLENPVNKFKPYFNDVNIYIGVRELINLLHNKPPSYSLRLQLERIKYAMMRRNNVASVFHQHYLLNDAIYFDSADDIPARISTLYEIAHNLRTGTSLGDGKELRRFVNNLHDFTANALKDTFVYYKMIHKKEIYNLRVTKDDNNDYKLFLELQNGEVLIIDLVDLAEIKLAEDFMKKFGNNPPKGKVPAKPAPVIQVLLDLAAQKQYDLNGYAYALKMELKGMDGIVSDYIESRSLVLAISLVEAARRLQTVVNLPVVNRTRRDNDYWEYVIQNQPFDPRTN